MRRGLVAVLLGLCLPVFGQLYISSPFFVAAIIRPTSSAPIPGTTWITDSPATSLRSDFGGGCVGVQVTPNGADIEVSALRLFVVSGNNDTVTVSFRKSGEPVFASAVFNTSGMSAGWNEVAVSVTLTNGNAYQLLRTLDGDEWNDEWTPTVTAVATVGFSLYSSDCVTVSGNTVGKSYSGVDFKYTSP